MKPYYEHGAVQIYSGDVREVLPQLESESVQCCVTSPPYWGLRDYGTAKWDGGDVECDHISRPQVSAKAASNGGALRDNPYKSECGKCGAARIDSQLGLEATPDLYIANMVAVFREVKRVLKGDGTLWLNMGDSYCSQPNQRVQKPNGRNDVAGYKQATNTGSLTQGSSYVPGLKPKDLIGVPWMLAFALRADGWYLRSDIIWHKPNPMPESVTDRPTKSHEYIFLLSKSERYYYDALAIADPAIHQGRTITLGDKSLSKGQANGANVRASGNGAKDSVVVAETRNKRTVWTVTTQPFPEAHFATFPEDLIKPCILAGCKAGDTVLDPFSGSGTTGLVARALHCKAILIELSADYIEIEKRRLAQDVLQFGCRVPSIEAAPMVVGDPWGPSNGDDIRKEKS